MKMKPGVVNALLAISFIVLWCTGSIVGKLGLPYAPPFNFLMLRYAGAFIVLLIISLATRAPWPSSWKETANICIAGLFLQTIYTASGFVAFLEVTPGLCAIILGAQPLLTAVVCRYCFKEDIMPMQWFGLWLGFGGLIFVAMNTLMGGVLSTHGLWILILSLLSITAGTLYQKRYCPNLDPRTACTLQCLVSVPVLATLSYFWQPMAVQWTGTFVFSLVWLILVLSVGAMLILAALIKRGDVTRVSSLFYLVPPLTVALDYFIFNDALSRGTFIGMLVVVLGVFMVNNPFLKKREVTPQLSNETGTV